MTIFFNTVVRVVGKALNRYVIVDGLPLDLNDVKDGGHLTFSKALESSAYLYGTTIPLYPSDLKNIRQTIKKAGSH